MRLNDDNKTVAAMTLVPGVEKLLVKPEEERLKYLERRMDELTC